LRPGVADDRAPGNERAERDEAVREERAVGIRLSNNQHSKRDNSVAMILIAVGAHSIWADGHFSS
jgi:hypothetical protein